MADNAADKELGLGVRFSATIEGFAKQITDIQTQLKEFAKQIEAYGKTSEKSVAGLTKATNTAIDATKKAAEASESLSKKIESASTIQKKLNSEVADSATKAKESTAAHGKTLETVQSQMKKLSEATQLEVASSKMSLPVYEELRKKLANSTTESLQYRNALAKIAMEQGQTVLGFKNLTSALDKNEKTIIDSRSGLEKLRMSMTGIPENLRVWSRDLNRVGLAHATLRGELAVSKGVIIEAGKSIVGTQHAVAALEKEFGSENVNKYKGQIGSSIRTMSDFKTALVANQKEQAAMNAHVIAAEKAISQVENRMNAMSTGSGTAWRKGINESAVASDFLQNKLSRANGVILESGSSFSKTEDKVKKFRETFSKSLSTETLNSFESKLGTTIQTFGEYERALKRASNNADEIRKKNAEAGEVVRKLGKDYQATTASVDYLARKVSDGTISQERAIQVMKEHNEKVRTLKASQETLASQNAILSNKFKELLSSTGAYGEEAKKVLSTMEAGRTSMTITYDNLNKINKAYLDNEKGIKSWNQTTESLATASEKVRDKMSRLQTQIDAGTKTHKQASEELTKYAKNLGELGTRATKAGEGVKPLTGHLMSMGAASNVAAGYLQKVSTAVYNLSAWSLAAAAIGVFSAAVGTAITAVVEWDQSLKNLQAISQGTDYEIKSLGERMLEISNNTKYSAAELSKGALYIAQAGFSASETLQVIGSAAKLAQGTMSEMNVTTDLLTTVLRVFKIPASESAQVVDKLAIAANKSKTDIEGLKTAFNYLGPVAQAAGLSLDETLASIMALANAGIKMSTVGTSMRQVISRLENPTAKLRNAIREAGMSVEDFNLRTHSLGQVCENLAKIIQGDAGNALAFFGERAGNAALIISGLGKDMDTMVSFMTEMGTASQMAAKQTEGLGVKLAMLRNHFENMVIKFSESGFATALGTVIDIITKFIDMIGILVNSSLVQFIAVVAAVTKALQILYGSIQILVATGLAKWVGTTTEAMITAIRNMGMMTTATTTLGLSLNRLSFTGFIAGIKGMITSIGEEISLVGVSTTATNMASRATVAWSGTLTALGGIIKSVVTSLTFWVAIITGIIMYINNMQTAHRRETEAVMQKSDKYLEISDTLKNYAKQLQDLQTNQSNSNNRHLENIAILQKLREQYPELSDKIGKTSLSIEEQVKILNELSKSYANNSEQMNQVSLTRIKMEMYQAADAAKWWQKQVDENTSGWTALGRALFALDTGHTIENFKIMAVSIGASFSSTVDKSKWMAEHLGNQLVIAGNAAQEYAQRLDRYSPEIRQKMLNSLPADEMGTKVRSIVAMNEKIKAMLEKQNMYTEKVAKETASALTTLGDDWVEYYNKMDSIGQRELTVLAITTAKKIAIKEKELEKAQGDAQKTAEIEQQIADLKIKTLEEYKKKREKLFDDMMKKIEEFYKKEEDLIKASFENRKQQIEVEKDAELNILNMKFTNEQDYLEKKRGIEEAALVKSKRVIEEEAKASEDSARAMYNTKKEFLEKQKLLVDDDSIRQKTLANEEQLNAKLVAIYQNELTQFKTMMGQKKQEIEQYRQAAIKAEQDIVAAKKWAADQQASIDDIIRKANQLTMNDQEKAQDDLLHFSEVMQKANQALAEANATSSRTEKEAKLKAMEEYINEAKGMISSLKVVEEDYLKESVNRKKREASEKLKTESDYLNELKGLDSSTAEELSKIFTTNLTDTKNTQIDAASKISEAVNKLKDAKIALATTDKETNQALAKNAQQTFDELKKAYDDLSTKMNTALKVQMDNTDALRSIEELKKQTETEFKVVVTFKGKASPEAPLDETISEIKGKLTSFKDELAGIATEFKIQFKATVATLNDAVAFSDVLTKIKTDVTDLANQIQAVTPPSITFWFWGDDGSVKDRFSKIYEKLKTDLSKLVTDVLGYVPKFIIYVKGNDNGTEMSISDLTQSLYSRFQALTTSINSMKAVYTIVTRYVTEGSAPSGGGTTTAFAEGGSVPGEGDSDSVPSMLTPGEFVMSKPTVKAFGTTFFEMLNSIKSGFSVPRFTPAGIPAFAGGGHVGSLETFNLNLNVGSEKIPLKVIGKPETMRVTIKRLEKELAKLKLSRG